MAEETKEVYKSFSIPPRGINQENLGGKKYLDHQRSFLPWSMTEKYTQVKNYLPRRNVDKNRRPLDTPPFRFLKTAPTAEKASGMSRQTSFRKIDCSAALKTFRRCRAIQRMLTSKFINNIMTIDCPPIVFSLINTLPSDSIINKILHIKSVTAIGCWVPPSIPFFTKYNSVHLNILCNIIAMRFWLVSNVIFLHRYASVYVLS